MAKDASKVQIVSKADFNDFVLPIMNQIFNGSDIYSDPFAKWVNEKDLLCEVLYELKSPTLESVVQAASAVGDKGFYVSLQFDIGPSWDQHWYVPFGDLNSYKHIFKLRVENFIFSPNAKWGVITSEEDFAIIGGANEFMTIFRENIPDLKNQLHEFLLRRQYEAQRNYKVGWVPSVLKYLFGEDKAKYYLNLYEIADKA
jgi:hypothetical protein